jgi:sugar phosphate permease
MTHYTRSESLFFTQSVSSRASRVFYGWWIVAACWLFHAQAGALLYHAFGAYFVHIQSEFGWSRTVISGGFSLARLEGGFLGPVQGWLISRFGPRAVVRIGVIVFGLGMMLLSTIQSVAAFYAAFVIVAIGAGMCGFLTLNIVIANWFERRRSRAIALAATGSSSAGLLVPLVALALDTFGWRATAFASGLLVIAIGIPISRVIRHTPEAYGYVPDGALPTPAAPGAQQETLPSPETFTGRAAIRTPSFWLISAGHSSALVAISALSAHLIPYLVEQMQMSLQTAATFAAAVTATSFASQLFGGFLGDRLNKRLLTTVCMAGHTGALIILATASTPIQVLAFALLQGMSWGVRGPLMTSIRADYFGRRALATVEGFASLVTTAGLVLGPLSTGYIADQVGDYRPAFVFLAGVTAVGMLCFGLAARPRAPAPILSS